MHMYVLHRICWSHRVRGQQCCDRPCPVALGLGVMYSQTSLIRIPRDPEENSWLQIYSIRDASNVTGVRLSSSLAYPDILWKTDVCG